MLELNNLKFIRGIDPNLAAGQRAVRFWAPDNGGNVSVYRYLSVPNSDYYQISAKSFTIYVRFLFLGWNYDAGFGSRVKLMAKNANGQGWSFELEGLSAQPTASFGGGLVRDTRPLPMDGFFHSFCSTRKISAPGDESNLSLVKIYRDGVAVPEASIARSGSYGNIDSANEVTIGGLDFAFLRGYLDIAMFCSDALTDAEVNALENSATRTDRGAVFIFNFNQESATGSDVPNNKYILPDSSSVGQIGEMQCSVAMAAGRAFVKTAGIRTFAKNSVLQAPLNGHFTPSVPVRVIGISRFDEELTAAEYSLDNLNWTPITFDTGRMSNNLPAFIEVGTLANPTLYFRATNTNPSWLNALELHY
jgi:hypothetical protein